MQYVGGLHFQIVRDGACLIWTPAVGSDELHEALRADYPHLDTLQQRMQQATLDFLSVELMHKQIEQQQVQLQYISPNSSNTNSPAYLTSPETSFASYTPPAETLVTTAEPAQPSQEDLMNTWTLTTATQTKIHKRRNMTSTEKEAYRVKRLQGACPDCKRRRRKCHHNTAGSGASSATSVSPQQEVKAKMLLPQTTGLRSRTAPTAVNGLRVPSQPAVRPAASLVRPKVEAATSPDAFGSYDFAISDINALDQQLPEASITAAEPFSWDMPVDQDWTLFSGVASPSSQMADDWTHGLASMPQYQQHVRPATLGFEQGGVEHWLTDGSFYDAMPDFSLQEAASASSHVMSTPLLSHQSSQSSSSSQDVLSPYDLPSRVPSGLQPGEGLMPSQSLGIGVPPGLDHTDGTNGLRPPVTDPLETHQLASAHFTNATCQVCSANVPRQPETAVNGKLRSCCQSCMGHLAAGFSFGSRYAQLLHGLMATAPDRHKFSDDRLPPDLESMNLSIDQALIDTATVAVSTTTSNLASSTARSPTHDSDGLKLRENHNTVDEGRQESSDNHSTYAAVSASQQQTDATVLAIYTMLLKDNLRSIYEQIRDSAVAELIQQHNIGLPAPSSGSGIARFVRSGSSSLQAPSETESMRAAMHHRNLSISENVTWPQSSSWFVRGWVLQELGLSRYDPCPQIYFDVASHDLLPSDILESTVPTIRVDNSVDMFQSGSQPQIRRLLTTIGCWLLAGLLGLLMWSYELKQRIVPVSTLASNISRALTTICGRATKSSSPRPRRIKQPSGAALSLPYRPLRSTVMRLV